MPIKSGLVTMGPKTLKFEESFTSYIGVKEVIAPKLGGYFLALSL